MKPKPGTGWTEDDLRENVEGKGLGGKRVKTLYELGEEEREAKAAWRRERDSTPDVLELMRGRRR